MTEAVPSARRGRDARITVIVPCYNDGATLPETIASLADAPEPLEIVVVDDASTDPATRTLLDELETREDLRVVRRERNGDVSAARMSGVAASSAPFVFPLDSDDLAVPHVLAQMADRLDAAPEAAACVGDYEEFGDHSMLRAVPAELDPYRVAFVNPFVATALFRRSALEKVGGWRSGAGYEDWDLWMALAEQGCSIVHAGDGVATFRRRTHGTRMLAERKRQHVAHYRDMQAHHPELFAALPQHRRTTTLSRPRQILYPLMYGGRRRFPAEVRLRRLLDRYNLWQLGR